MGLHGQLNDVSSESIPILMIALIARCVGYLRSVLAGILYSVGLNRFEQNHHHNNRAVNDDLLGSGLAGLIVLTEQLKLNRLFSFRYSERYHGHRGRGSDCMVCLYTLRDGDRVRMLDCRHVFHKDCFDGWLDHHNFNCPLCRSPLVEDQRVVLNRQRVGSDLIGWFSFQ